MVSVTEKCGFHCQGSKFICCCELWTDTEEYRVCVSVIVNCTIVRGYEWNWSLQGDFFFCVYIFALFQLHLMSGMLCFIFFYYFLLTDHLGYYLKQPTWLTAALLISWKETWWAWGKQHTKVENEREKEAQGIKREKRTEKIDTLRTTEEERWPEGIDLPLWGVY